MVRVRVLKRNAADYVAERPTDVQPATRNYRAAAPFQRAREYTRALNATKVERMLSKPFVGSMPHHDRVESLCKSPTALRILAAGSSDGELRLWNLLTRRTLWSTRAHHGPVRDISFDPRGQTLVTVSTDSACKVFRQQQPLAAGNTNDAVEPFVTLTADHALHGVTHHHGVNSQMFATCGSESVQLWVPTRSQAVQEFSWADESVTSIAFNPSEHDLLGSCSLGRAVTLYDIRQKKELRRITMAMNCNALRWNPMEPQRFLVGCEDSNVYLFDMRKLASAKNVFMDHTEAVMDVDWCPTGTRFVTGSYDRTLRLWDVRKGRSVDTFYLKRMQRVFSTVWSLDSQYVVSGSDDGNVRVWRSKPAVSARQLLPREERAREYNAALKKKFAHVPELKRIDGFRKIPKVIKKQRDEAHVMRMSRMRKETNKRNHSKPGSVVSRPERKKHVLREDE